MEGSLNNALLKLFAFLRRKTPMGQLAIEERAWAQFCRFFSKSKDFAVILMNSWKLWIDFSTILHKKNPKILMRFEGGL